MNYAVKLIISLSEIADCVIGCVGVNRNINDNEKLLCLFVLSYHISVATNC